MVKMVLALSVLWRVLARHGDVPNAYVRAENEDKYSICMRVPDEMEFNESEKKQAAGIGAAVVLRLKKSFYGLKQIGRLWNKLLDGTLKKNGFKQCIAEPCLY